MKIAIIIILALIVIVMYHEAGHLLACKFCKIPVKEFAVGFGPRIPFLQHKTKSGMLLSVHVLPFGGFCDINEDLVEQSPLLQKLLIYGMGCVHNLIIAVICLAVMAIHMGATITGALSYAIEMTVQAFALIYSTVISSVADLITSIICNTATGPIHSTVDAVRDASNTSGVDSITLVLVVIAIINIGLAAFNLFPVPALDGGWIAFALINAVLSKIIGKQIPLHVINTINTISYYVVTIFSIGVLLLDINRSPVAFAGYIITCSIGCFVIAKFKTKKTKIVKEAS